MASVITITTGEPGSGKSYIRAARFLVDEFLINSDGIHISNFPLNVDEIAAEVYKRKNLLSKNFLSRFFRRFKELNIDDIKKRIHIIPDEVLKSWRNQSSGPWDYFSDADLKGAHIAIDEIHEIISFSKNQDYIDKWDEFLGQIRHRGCTFEGLTQDLKAVHSCLVNRAGIRFEIYPAENTRDPFFKIPMYDWYQLKAAFTGDFHKTVFQIEKKKTGSGRWKVNHSRRFLIIPEYFKFYNSFSASHQEKETSRNTIDENRTPLYEYQKYTKTGLLFWFIRRNFFTLSIRLSLYLFLCWVLLFGGLNTLLHFFINSMQSVSKTKTVPANVQSAKKSDLEKNQVSKEIKSSETSQISNIKKDVISPYIPVMIANNYVVTLGGLHLSVGYKFKKGSLHENKRVVFLDPYARSYTLSDGSIIRMQNITQ